MCAADECRRPLVLSRQVPEVHTLRVTEHIALRRVRAGPDNVLADACAENRLERRQCRYGVNGMQECGERYKDQREYPKANIRDSHKVYYGI